MKAFERSIQRDYSKMPPFLRRYFICEGKWFGVISAFIHLVVIGSMLVYLITITNGTWLVGGDRLLTENLKTLPHPVGVIFSGLLLVCTPRVISICARTYYENNRKKWS